MEKTKKKLVVLTGAGMSAESGIKTFRDADGLWEGHDVMAVASPIGFEENPELVLEFYNQRRRQLKEVQPNAAHFALAELENDFEVQVITQNVDDLHERAGSSYVLHLHGELKKVKPVGAEEPILDWPDDLNLGHTDERGVQLRPHVVWFGEAVPNIIHAEQLVAEADMVVVIGSSMQVYPAAGLLQAAKENVPIYLIDPKDVRPSSYNKVTHIKATATEGMKQFMQLMQ